MAHRYGSPGAGERIVAKGLAGRPREPGQVPRLATHATRSVDLESVDASSSLKQEDSYSPMTERSAYQTRARFSNHATPASVERMPSQAVTKNSTGSWNKTRAARVWLCEFTPRRQSTCARFHTRGNATELDCARAPAP